ncbi:peptidylprolyl isomerase [uncultured Microbulbifer sp.]|uniref:peptidylprolyl isomerase n=1 Tax=uncultured Microbulbifer sp. TaxID=348147 RepID=UPI00261E4EAD|nr:peptidylprolyl isomerase [uncultured Microbulbifer sp.]
MKTVLASDALGRDFELAEAVAVNGREVPADLIYQEMQYQSADSPRQAVYRAARALVIGWLLREQAAGLGLCAADEDLHSAVFDRAVADLLKGKLVVIPPDATECRAYFEARRQKFCSDPLAEVRHILMPAAPDDADTRAKARAGAEALLEEIRADANPLQTFARLAGFHSACSSAGAGGSLGQVGRGDTVDAFERAVFAQGTGLVPSPVETPYGVHLIYVEQCEPGRPLEYTYVAERIRDYLLEKRRRQMTGDYLNRLVESAEITGLDLSGPRVH